MELLQDIFGYFLLIIIALTFIKAILPVLDADKDIWEEDSN